MKKISLFLLILFPMLAMAQSGTNSPYSQFGLGILSDQSTGFNRGMNGVSQAWHQSAQVNYQNPASYAFIDSLTFLLDVGASAQVTNFKEGSHKVNANNANFEYVVSAFRIMKNVGMSVGIMPFSNIGYNYASSGSIPSDNTQGYTTTYNGQGGTRTLYMGIGWQPLKGLAIGANIGYFWGTYSKSVVNTFSNSEASTIARYYSADISSYNLDLGMQYDLRLGRKDVVTIGGSYTFGHKTGGSADMSIIESNTQTTITDTTNFSLDRAIAIPTRISGGLAWRHSTKWHVGIDYSYQKWTQFHYPDFENNKYIMSSSVLLDRHKFALGGEYVPNATSRRYLNRVHIRAGVGYATPYIKVNGKDGPNELSASLGLGLPISVAPGRSIVNISGQWVRNSADGLIGENTFRFNLGITFNERWFMKWKLE